MLKLNEIGIGNRKSLDQNGKNIFYWKNLLLSIILQFSKHIDIDYKKVDVRFFFYSYFYLKC